MKGKCFYCLVEHERSRPLDIDLAVCLYCKIRTSQGTNQKAAFHHARNGMYCRFNRSFAACKSLSSVESLVPKQMSSCRRYLLNDQFTENDIARDLIIKVFRACDHHGAGSPGRLYDKYPARAIITRIKMCERFSYDHLT